MQREPLHAFSLDVSQVDVALGVESDRVDPVDLAWLGRRNGGAGEQGPHEDFACGVQLHQQLVRGRRHDPATAIRLPDPRRPANPNLVALGHGEPPRHEQTVPHGQQFAVSVKDLNPAVVAIGNINAVLGVDRDRVWQGKLAGCGALVAPCFEKAAMTIEADDTPVTLKREMAEPKSPLPLVCEQMEPVSADWQIEGPLTGK